MKDKNVDAHPCLMAILRLQTPWVPLAWKTECPSPEAQAMFHFQAVAGSSDGQVLQTTGEDRSVRSRYVSSRNNDLTSGHGGGVSALTWSVNSKVLASGDRMGTIRLWSDGECRLLEGHSGPVYGLAFAEKVQQLMCT